MEKIDSIYDWVARIIATSNNSFHFDAVDKLIDLYFERERDEAKYTELKLLKKIRWEEIHNILS
jgi:hypothetical protein